MDWVPLQLAYLKDPPNTTMVPFFITVRYRVERQSLAELQKEM